MALQPPGRRLDSRTLERAILAMYLRQMLNGEGPQQRPQQSGVKDVLDTVKKGREAYRTGKNVYDIINGATSSTQAGSTVATEAANQAWNAGADAAYQAGQDAWNAGANQASGLGPASTPGAEGGIDGAGALAAAASVLRSGQRFQGTSRDEQKAYEASMAIPRAIAAYYTLGGSELAEGFARKQWGGTMKKFDKFMMNNPMSPVFVPMQASKLWTSDKWKTEGNRLKKLIDQGINVPDSYQAPMRLVQGRKKSELVNPNYAADFIGQTKDGFVNNKFANSRNEADLRPEDIWGYASFFEKYGNDWLGKFNEQQRREIAQKALDAGAVRERHGTVDVDWAKVEPPKPAQTAPQPQINNKPQISNNQRVNTARR